MGTVARALTIGLIACDVYEEVTRAFWQGVADSVHEKGINLIFFSGGALEDPLGYRGQGNILYDLVSPHRIDGLIITSSSLDFASSRLNMANFIKKFGNIPIVSLEEHFPGIASILKDDYSGMTKIMEHQIQAHHRRRIVFMRGPAGFPGAGERYQAYHDSLEENLIPFDPNLVTPAPKSWAYTEALSNFRTFLDDHALQPRFDFDAVVAANDENAYAAVTILQERGLRIPDDISITGFDDLAIAGSISPAMTTVRSPFAEMGSKAVELLLECIHGKIQLEPVLLPTQLVVRHSCGCLLPTIAEASIIDHPTTEKFNPTHSLALSLLNIRKSIVNDMALACGGGAESIRWAGQVLNGFVSELDHGAQGMFLSALDMVLNQVIQQGRRVKEWQRALSIMRELLIPVITDSRILFLANNLWHQGRVLVGEMSWRNQSWKRLQAEDRARRLSMLGARLATSLEIEVLCTALHQELPQLGIARCFLMLYMRSDRPADQATMVMGYDETGKLCLSDQDNIFNSVDLLPEVVWQKMNQFSLIIEGLYLQSEQLGFVCLDASGIEGRQESEVFGALQMQISSSVKAALLHRDARAAREQAEAGWQLAEERRRTAEEANQLKSRFLSMVSHDLRTPLNVIIGLSENLLQEWVDNTAFKAMYHDLEHIHTSAQHLDNLIRDVLDLAVSHVGQLRLVYERLDIAVTLQPVIEIGTRLARNKGLTWIDHIQENLPSISWDRTRLSQVVLNLLTNAIKFTEQGEVILSVDAGEDCVLFSIQDTGLGIPPKEQSIIFEEFNRSERVTARGFGGMGLGLAICRRLVEMGGGKIWVESSGEIGKGSRFIFSLPILKEVLEFEPPISNQTILLLTENENGNQVLQNRLEKSGYEVKTMSLQNDINWLQKIQETPPGAMIVDAGIDSDLGWATISLVKSNPKINDVPILFCTLTRENDHGAFFELNYLEKPVGERQLAKVLDGQGWFQVSSTPLIMIVDDESNTMQMNIQLVKAQFPGCKILCAQDGKEALEKMKLEQPDLILLDLMMPVMNGFQVLAAMRENEGLRSIPVIVLTSQKLTEYEMQQLNLGVTAILEKGLFSSEETLAQLETALKRNKRLGSEARRIARRVMAYIHENYPENLSRKELAEVVGVTQEYLSTCFRKETGLTPSTYIERYRIKQAKKLLETSDLPISEVAAAVGFFDSSYFGRVFRREVGVTPNGYRKGERIE